MSLLLCQASSHAYCTFALQVIFALPPVGDTDLTMRIYNSDGSEPEMCGNGIRCLARFVADVDGAAARKYKIHTLAGWCVVSLQQLILTAQTAEAACRTVADSAAVTCCTCCRGHVGWVQQPSMVTR
eukprot:GHUV01034697.1.p1 GENE.GHUV01034697.1~~GHUV01034697.1.p1  ORF type:complete len:127 (-),score=24.42 GHUV01034697.1:303-683(-)